MIGSVRVAYVFNWAGLGDLMVGGTHVVYVMGC